MKLSSVSLVAFVLPAMLSGCGQEEKKQEVAVVQVDVLEVKKSNSLKVLSYSGTIEPENTAQIGFSVAGVVNTIAVEEGQAVKEGQFLAGIDASEYQNALAIATAGLEQAEDMYTRLNGLYEKGSLPAKDYIDIKTKLAQAKANRSINAKHIQDSRLIAPISGIVASRLIERGSMAAPGSPAFVIVKTDKVYARISVPESEVGVLKRGMETRVYIATLKDTVTGNITIINPLADPISKTYVVKIKLDNKEGRLLPGMIARIDVSSGQNSETLIVPATAVIRDADEITYLYVVDKNQTAIRKRIMVTGISGTDQVIVLGLQEGDQVVIAGQSKLKDGSKVSH